MFVLVRFAAGPEMTARLPEGMVMRAKGSGARIKNPAKPGSWDCRFAGKGCGEGLTGDGGD
jgi:hypothetical protein